MSLEQKDIDSRFKSKRIKEYIYLLIGTFILSIGINFFLKPNMFINGGLTGLLLLVEELFHTDQYVSFNTLFLGINVLLLAVGGKVLGSKDFMIKTIVATLALSAYNYLWTYLIDGSPFLQSFIIDDILLVTVYASLLVGTGVGIVIRSGGTTGGIDIPQKILNKEFKFPYIWCTLMTDGAIILLGFTVFGPERGMYALMSVYIIGKVIDTITIGISNATATYVITDRKEVLTRIIFQSIDRGVTVVPAIGGYSNMEKDMLLVICSNRKEHNELRLILHLYDPNAFVFSTKAADIEGLGFGNRNKKN